MLPANLRQSLRVRTLSYNTERLSKGARRRRRVYLQRKAAAATERPKHVHPKILAKERRREEMRFQQFIKDPKLAELDRQAFEFVKQLTGGDGGAPKVAPDGDVPTTVPMIVNKKEMDERFETLYDSLCKRVHNMKDHGLNKKVVQKKVRGLGNRFDRLSKLCRNATNAETLKNFVETIQEDKIWEEVPVSVHVSLSEAYARSGLIDEALAMREATGVQPDADFLTSILDGCLLQKKKQSLARGWELYNTFLTRYNISRSLEAYERLIELSAMQGEPERALQLTEEAMLLGIEQDMMSPFSADIPVLRRNLYHSTLHACSKSIHYAYFGDTILQRMLGEGIQPDQSTFSLALACYSRVADCESAELAWDMFTNELGIAAGPDQYSGLMNVYAKSQWNSRRKHKSVYRLFDPFKPNNAIAPYNEAAAVANRLRFDESYLKGDQMWSKELKQVEDEREQFILEQEQARVEYEEAESRWAEDMEGFDNLHMIEDTKEVTGVDLIDDNDDSGASPTFEPVAKNSSGTDIWDAAIGFDEEPASDSTLILRRDTDISKYTDNEDIDFEKHVPYAEALRMHEEYEEDDGPMTLEKARDRLALSKQNRGVGEMTIRAMVPAHVTQASNIKKAEALLEQMIEREVKPDEATLNNLCRVYSLAFRATRAEAVVFERFKDFELKPNKHSYHALIEMYVRTQRINKAKELAYALMQTKGFQYLRPDSWAILMDGLARHNELKEATTILKELKENGEVPDERHLRLLRLRSRVARFYIPEELMPRDPNEWKKPSKIRKALHSSNFGRSKKMIKRTVGARRRAWTL